MSREPSMRRRTLLASTATGATLLSGCLGLRPGLTDLRLFNLTEERQSVDLRVQNRETGNISLQRDLEMEPYDRTTDRNEVGVREYVNPVSSGDPHEVRVDVVDGPTGSGTYTEPGNGALDRGEYLIRARINPDGVDFERVSKSELE